MEQVMEYGNSSYNFSFFTMTVDVQSDLRDLLQLSDYDLGLYFHEYVHFLQDISTIYGLISMSNTTYYIQGCAHYIAKINKSKEFEVPLSIENISNNDPLDKGRLNFEVQQIYVGSSINPKAKTVQNLSYIIEQHQISDGNKTEIVKMQFLNEYDEKRSFEFGGAILCEGMAYLCEKEFFVDVLPKSEEYPYGVVEKVVELVYPDLFNDKIAIVALCDIALMTYHPGLSFIRLLNYVRDNDLITKFADPIEFYSECNNFLKGSHVDFEVLITNVKNDIFKNFNDPYFEDLRTWINIVFSNVQDLRKELPFFIPGILIEGNLRHGKYFNHVLDTLGTPLVLNGDGKASIRPPVNFKTSTPYFNPGMFMAINQAMRIFRLKTPSPCKLLNFCTASTETVTDLVIDDNCYRSPWKRSEGLPYCHIGQIWRHWALAGYSPKYREE